MKNPSPKPGLVRAATLYLGDPRVTLWRKLVGAFGVAYVVSPIDLIPDVIPILGWLDDLGVFTLVAWFVVREVTRHAKQVAQEDPGAIVPPK